MKYVQFFTFIFWLPFEARRELIHQWIFLQSGMWDWTYTGHMLVIPDGNILALGLFLAIGSCLLKCTSFSQSKEHYSDLDTEKKPQGWTELTLSSIKQATNFRWEFHMNWSLQVYLQPRIVCMQGTAAHYPEKYLNGHWRNIKKFQ